MECLFCRILLEKNSICQRSLISLVAGHSSLAVFARGYLARFQCNENQHHYHQVRYGFSPHAVSMYMMPR